MDQTQPETKIYDDFNESFQKLLKVSSNVLNDLEEYGYDVRGNKNILKAKRGLDYYMSCYHNTKPKERYLHLKIFRKIFDRHQEGIVAGTSTTEKWLKTPHQISNSTSTPTKTLIKIVFRQTEDYDVTLYIGFIFVVSLQLRVSAETKNKDVSDEEYDKCDAIFYPEWILLYLKKIFREFASEDERIDFITQIGVLEKNLGVDQESSNGLGGNISGITNMVANLMKDSGMMPSDSEGIDITQIGNALSNVMNNKDAQNALSEMVNGITKSNNLGDVVKTITDKVGDPRLTGALQREINKATGKKDSDVNLSNGEESSTTGMKTQQTVSSESQPDKQKLSNTAVGTTKPAVNTHQDSLQTSTESNEEVIITSGAVPVITSSSFPVSSLMNSKDL